MQELRNGAFLDPISSNKAVFSRSVQFIPKSLVICSQDALFHSEALSVFMLRGMKVVRLSEASPSNRFELFSSRPLKSMLGLISCKMLW